MTDFDKMNHWLVDRGDARPSVNVVVLSFGLRRRRSFQEWNERGHGNVRRLVGRRSHTERAHRIDSRRTNGGDETGDACRRDH